MPPKSGSKPPTKQGSPDESPEQDLEDALIDTLEAIFDQVGAYIDESHMQACAVTAAVDSCIESSLYMVDMAYIVREEHPMHHLSLEKGSWDPDVEPEPCLVDTWVRGAIPCEARKGQAPASKTVTPGESSRGSNLNLDTPVGSPQPNTGESSRLAQ